MLELWSHRQKHEPQLCRRKKYNRVKVESNRYITEVNCLKGHESWFVPTQRHLLKYKIRKCKTFSNKTDSMNAGFKEEIINYSVFSETTTRSEIFKFHT